MENTEDMAETDRHIKPVMSAAALCARPEGGELLAPAICAKGATCAEDTLAETLAKPCTTKRKALLSNHARIRCQQRGLRPHQLADILDHADIEQPVGGNCRLLRVSRVRAQVLNRDDRLAHFAIILSDHTGQIVTVMPLHHGRGGARYRRAG